MCIHLVERTKYSHHILAVNRLLSISLAFRFKFQVSFTKNKLSDVNSKVFLGTAHRPRISDILELIVESNELKITFPSKAESHCGLSRDPLED